MHVWDIFAVIPETNAALDFLLDGGEPFGIEPFDRLAKIGPHKGLGQDDLQTAKRDAARADIDANQFFDAGEAALGFGYLAELSMIAVDREFRDAGEEVFLLAEIMRWQTTAISRCIGNRSEEHTSELQSLMRTSYAVFC